MRWPGRMLVLILGAMLAVAVASAEEESEEDATLAQGEEKVFRAPGLAGLEWLLGTWRSEVQGQVTEETWRRVSPHTMEGESRRLPAGGGKPTFTESLRLVEMQGQVFYLAKVGENPLPVAFQLVASEGDAFVFENPAHDFPQRVIYDRQSDVAMRAAIEGKAAAGKGAPRRAEWSFRKAD